MIKPPVLKLTLRQPNSEAARMTLEGAKITMGRSADCTLPIRDRFLSRHHAEFIFQNGAWHVRDGGSANGTFLNGARLESLERVRDGDIVMLGDSELQLGGPAESTPRFSVDDSNSGLSIVDPDQADRRYHRKTHASQRIHGVMFLPDLRKSDHYPCRYRELSGR